MKSSEEGVLDKLLHAWQLPQPAIRGVLHRPRHLHCIEEFTKIAHMHVKSVGQFDSYLVTLQALHTGNAHHVAAAAHANAVTI